MAAEIEGLETLTFSAASAIEPLSPTATRYSNWRRVNRKGIGLFRGWIRNRLSILRYLAQIYSRQVYASPGTP